MMALLSGIRERVGHWKPCCTPSPTRKVLDWVTIVIDCRVAGKRRGHKRCTVEPSCCNAHGIAKDC